MGTAFHCSNCHLGIEVGCGLYWDLSAAFSQAVCRVCGTMHFIEHPTDGCDVLYSQLGPITWNPSLNPSLCVEDASRDTQPLPTDPALYGEKMPVRIAAAAWSALACRRCGSVGEISSPMETWPDDGSPCDLTITREGRQLATH